MFVPGTVIVLGAGASYEAGFPLGATLIEKIQTSLRVTRRGGDLNQSDIALLQALNGVQSPMIMEMLDGLKHANSIDAYLFSRNDSAAIVKAGKICIAHALLQSEASSRCYYDFRETIMRNEQAMLQTHYESLFRIAKDGIDRENLYKLFTEFSIINFNYDRSIKHYLLKATQAAFGVDARKAAECVGRLRIIQPYGGLGPLPWENTQENVAYGDISADIGHVASRIYTFSEDHSAICNIHDEIKITISNATRLLFLGFGFHKQNMDILTPLVSPAGMTYCDTIFLTTVGISETDKQTIGQSLSKWQPLRSSLARLVFNDNGCYQIFAENRLSMAE